MVHLSRHSTVGYDENGRWKLVALLEDEIGSTFEVWTNQTVSGGGGGALDLLRKVGGLAQTYAGRAARLTRSRKVLECSVYIFVTRDCFKTHQILYLDVLVKKNLSYCNIQH